MNRDAVFDKTPEILSEFEQSHVTYTYRNWGLYKEDPNSNHRIPVILITDSHSLSEGGGGYLKSVRDLT